MYHYGLDPLAQFTIVALVSIVRGRLSQCLTRVSPLGLVSIPGLPLFQRPLQGYPLSESTVIELVFHSGIRGTIIPVSCSSFRTSYNSRAGFQSGDFHIPVSCRSVPAIPVYHYRAAPTILEYHDRAGLHSGTSTIPGPASAPAILVYH